MSATMPCHHANHNVGHIIGRLINVLYIRHHVRHIVGHQDSRLVGNLVNLFVQHHVHYVSYIVDHLVNIQYPCPPPCHLVNSWQSTPTQTGHCQAISCFGLEEMCLLIVSNSMMTLGHWLINHSADVQERHMVYEYWVSFSGVGGSSSNMERETAELIQPLVCNINKQKCGLQHWILSRTISPFFFAKHCPDFNV